MRGRTRVRIAEDVAHVADERGVYAALLPDGPPQVLSGGAVVVWAHLGSPVTLERLVGLVARDAGVAPGELDDEIARCVAQLARLGLVVLDG